MRLWSLSPKYLDRQGLLAVWREGLLAKKVLAGKTKGYKTHPQLNRFKDSGEALKYIDAYLFGIYLEAEDRGYKFRADKIDNLKILDKRIEVAAGQVIYEFRHLLNKLKTRDPRRYKDIKDIKTPAAHFLFKVVPGNLENWEKVIKQ